MSQPIRLGEAEMRDGPLQVSGLRVFGNDRTQASFFEHEFAPALASRSLVALHRNLEAAANRLQSTGVFDSADLELDLSSSARDGAPTAVVNVRVKEKTKPFLQVGVNAGARADATVGGPQLSSADVAGEVQAVLPNLVGLAETYKLSMRTNDRGDKDMQCNISFPSISSRRMPLHLGVKSFVEDKHGLSSFKTNYRSISAGTSSSDGSHRLSLEFIARDESVSVALPPHSQAGPGRAGGGAIPVLVAGSGKLASHDVSNSIVPSTKTSLLYVFTQDSRNSVSNPTSGGYLEFQSEVAFPPGTVDFVKSSLSLQRHVEVGPPLLVPSEHPEQHVSVPGLSLSLAGAIAAVLPIGVGFVETGKRTPVPLCDRFFSGGNFFLRGFAPFSIGPRSAPFSNENFSGGVAGGDALGGLIKSNALIAVSVPLPIAAAARSGARAFAFCSAGAVDSPHSLRNTSISEIISGSSKIKPIELLSEVARASRLTVGCGSSLSLGPVRLEASYAVPLRRDTGDAMRQFQIGIGISIA